MNTLFTVYTVIGVVFFVIAFAVTQFGRAFSSEKFNFKEAFTYLALFGVLWPIGLAMIIYALTKPHKPL